MEQRPETTTKLADDSHRRALVVDDERDLAQLVADYLRRDGFTTSLVHDGISAVDSVRALSPDVVILDLNLPGQSGIEACRQIRQFSDCPIIMLTARSEETDVLIGLSIGADDYMTKPFRPRELLARVQTILRRPRLAQPGATTAPTPGPNNPGPSPAPTASPQLSIGALLIDLDRREALLAGQPVSLTRTEFDILAILAAHPNRVFTRGNLVESIWGSSLASDERLADAHIVHLRQKLGDSAEGQRYIRTVRGVGYRAGEG